MRHLVCLNFPSSIGFNQCSSATILVSFSVHFCLGRKKEIINLYCNPLSIATIFFPRREGGWNGRVHVTFFSTHYMKRTIAVLSLVYRSAGSRKIDKWSTQHWKIFDLFFNKFSKIFVFSLPELWCFDVVTKNEGMGEGGTGTLSYASRKLWC